MNNIAATLPYYENLRTSISAINPNYQVFGNAGTNTLQGYTSAADVLVTFENQTGYSTNILDAWTANYSANQFANLLYNISTAADMQAAITLAVSRNVGYVYVTDDNGANPWDTLPSYWNSEISAVSAVPEPSNALLLLVGLGFIGLQTKRRLLKH